MHVNLTYQHWSGEIIIRFNLTHPNEEAFGFGFGSTPEEAKAEMVGLFTKESEAHDKSYKIDNQKPYLYLFKKNKDGAQTISSHAINVVEVFRDTKPAPANSITTLPIDF
jgi:hypothetical protein